MHAKTENSHRQYVSYYQNRPLVASHGAALHHGSVLLLEALVQPGGALEVLVNTTHDASLLAVDERLGGEVIDTVIEAALDHLGVHLEERMLDLDHSRRQMVDGKHGITGKGISVKLNRRWGS